MVLAWATKARSFAFIAAPVIRPANIMMIAITTIISMSVKPEYLFFILTTSAECVYEFEERQKHRNDYKSDDETHADYQEGLQ